jgi:hypothetical protein
VSDGGAQRFPEKRQSAPEYYDLGVEQVRHVRDCEGKIASRLVQNPPRFNVAG